MENTVRWGILGTGKIARAMALGLRDAPGAQLVAVASRSDAGAQAFGASNVATVPTRRWPWTPAWT